MGTSTCGEDSPLPEIAFSPDTQPDLDPACKWLKGCRITKCPLRYICRFIFFQRADGNSVPGGREGGRALVAQKRSNWQMLPMRGAAEAS
jgi:hypothetical protein